MFVQKLQYLFIAMITLALLYLSYNYYQAYRFKIDPLSPEIQAKIDAKEHEIQEHILRHYNLHFDVPLIVSDELPSKLYGMAVLQPQGQIKIFINKKRIRESLQYILDDVIAHEYAHALMFLQGQYGCNDGHSEQWQEICLVLGGSRCDRFVNHNDIIYEKISF